MSCAVLIRIVVEAVSNGLRMIATSLALAKCTKTFGKFVTAGDHERSNPKFDRW